MCKSLVDFGFGRLDAEVYVFLALNGPNSASAITGALGVDKWQIYRVLKKLERRHILFRSHNLPALFSVLSFDRFLDLLSKTNLLEAKKIEQKKEDLLVLWNSCIKMSREKRFNEK
jgi:sugar-specific transcriptional regulator TrmB